MSERGGCHSQAAARRAAWSEQRLLWFLRVVSDNTYLNASVALYWASPSKSDLTLHVDKIHAVRGISPQARADDTEPKSG